MVKQKKSYKLQAASCKQIQLKAESLGLNKKGQPANVKSLITNSQLQIPTSYFLLLYSIIALAN